METIQDMQNSLDMINYLQSINQGDEYNPMIEFVDRPIYLYDQIRKLVMKSYYYGGKYNKFYSFTDYDSKLKEFVRHVYAARFTTQVEIMEVRRDFETHPSVVRNLYYNEYGYNRGTQVVWKNKRSYYIQIDKDDKYYTLENAYYNKMAYIAQELQNPNVISVIDPDLKYYGYKECEVNIIDYIKQYRKFPIVETFMKLGLYRLIMNQKAIDFTSSNKAFRKWLYANAEDCQGLAFATIKNAWKKNPNGNVLDYYNSLQYRILLGKEMSQANKEQYEFIKNYTTQEKLYEYLGEYEIGINSYFDYVKAARYLQLDFKDTKVLFPRNFNEVHDVYVDIYNRNILEIEKAEARKKFEAFKKDFDRVVKKYSFLETKGVKWAILIAKSQEELIEEGKMLKHCVGKMEYDKKIAKGESLIFFVRNINDIDKPYVTFEVGIENGFKLRQIHGENNCRPDKEVCEYVDAFVESAKKKILKKRKGSK